jgi:KR domain
MMEKGARSFVFISRSGTDKADAEYLVNSLIDAGANVQVFRADASNAGEVARIVSEVNSTSSIRGVVHAAMVLQVGFTIWTWQMDN